MNGEGGFTIVEAMISITILAVGAFAVAQATMFGLSTTGLSRQQLSSRAAVDQQMEEARALNYDNLVLSDTNPLTHSADATNPRPPGGRDLPRPTTLTEPARWPPSR